MIDHQETQVLPDDSYQGLVKRAAAMYASGADKTEILEEIVQIKQTLTDHAYAISRATSVADAIANAVAPDIEWRYEENGWSFGPRAATSPASPTQRKLRTLELATAMVRESVASRVKTRAIAERMRAEGDAAPVSDLGTAIGNILSRAEGWSRVGPGEYQYRPEE